ncbi:MAG: hypothetical protein S4CHLAM20_12180 [Chlamydiia bacterium]|nr:hypothetical protein [Chlamydiia bacterium]
MEYLFNYTRNLCDSIDSLIKDMIALQRILDEKKNSKLSQENLFKCKKELKKELYFLRILEQIFYLEEYQIDIGRAVESVDEFLSKDSYLAEDSNKISYYLSGICYNYIEFDNYAPPAPVTLQQQVAVKLDDIMKTVEEILLSFYGLISPVDDLEEKLINKVEELFYLDLENLEMEEKLLIEDYFNQIQFAFQQKSTEGWETAYIKCTGILNDLKTRAGMDISSSLQITFESEDEEADDYIIEFEIEEENDYGYDPDDKEKQSYDDSVEDDEEDEYYDFLDDDNDY